LRQLTALDINGSIANFFITMVLYYNCAKSVSGTIIMIFKRFSMFNIPYFTKDEK